MRKPLNTLVGGIEASEGPRLPTRREGQSPFFGRGRELDELNRTLREVLDKGECRAVTILGAEGTGKTRLIDELIESIAALESPAVRVYRAQASVGGARWASFTQLLSQRFKLADLPGPDEAKEALRSEVASVLDDRKVGDVLYYLGELVELEFAKSPLTKALDDGSPESIALAHAIIKTFFEADATFGPLCFVLDDIDSCHEATLGLLRFLFANVRGQILFVAAARPEFLARDPGWTKSERHAFLELEPLGDVESRALIGTLLVPSGITPMHLVEQAREVAGGNPGRIDEVARFYRDKGTLPPPSARPEELVKARIDQLSSADRHLLQKAALVGGVFWLGALVVLDRADGEPPEQSNGATDESRQKLAERLGRLVEQDYLMRLPDSTFAGDEEYVFRHRVDRERLAGLTSASDARTWHRCIAEWLDGQVEVASHEEYLEMLAEHWEKSGNAEGAAMVLFEAASLARGKDATKHELGYLEKALGLLGDARWARRLDALIRIAFLLETIDKRDEALTRCREITRLAFRLDRRADGMAGHLAAFRLLQKLGRHDEAGADLASAEDLSTLIPDASGAQSVRVAVSSFIAGSSVSPRPPVAVVQTPGIPAMASAPPPSSVAPPSIAQPLSALPPSSIAPPPIGSPLPSAVQPPIGSPLPSAVQPPIGSPLPSTVQPPIGSPLPSTVKPPIGSPLPSTVQPPIGSPLPSAAPPSSAAPLPSTAPPPIGSPLPSAVQPISPLPSPSSARPPSAVQ